MRPARFQAIASHGNNASRAGDRQRRSRPSLQFRHQPIRPPVRQQLADILTNNGLVNDGTWHFIAGVSDGSSAYLYVDAVPVRTNAGVTSVAGATYDFLLGGDPDNITPVYNSGGTAIRYLDGQIAQVAFFTNTLTGAQLQQLYSAAGVPPSIVTQPPASVGANSGQLVSIPITAKGSPTLAYQWYRSSGAAASGQTSAALMFNPVSLANAGSYYVVVTNSYGRRTSSVVASDRHWTADRGPAVPDRCAGLCRHGAKPARGRGRADAHILSVDPGRFARQRGHRQQLPSQHHRDRYAHVFAA